jgi:hypothetical protein
MPFWQVQKMPFWSVSWVPVKNGDLDRVSEWVVGLLDYFSRNKTKRTMIDRLLVVIVYIVSKANQKQQRQR